MNNPQPDSYDLIVIGGGPAGVTAALRAREMGASVALVERDRLGGTCTNDGCVPTRVLAKAARLLRDTEQFEQYGIDSVSPSLDFPRLMQRVQQVVYSIHEKKQLIRYLQGSGVEVFAGVGAAAFVNPQTIKLPDGHQLHAEKFILAVGGHARRLGFPGAEYALTHSDVWSLRDLPRSVVIVGAAATGCQLATIFAAFGAEVTLLDLAPRILPAEDPDLSNIVAQVFQENGVHILTGIDGVQQIEKTPQGLVLHYTNAGAVQSVEAEAIVLAVGWPGNIEPLNLQAAGVEAQGAYIKVNEYLQTTTPHIYAVGDVTGRMMLVQSASYEARIAVENAVLGTRNNSQHQVVPHGGFTDPEYGSVGLTEVGARAYCIASGGVEEDVVSVIVPFAELDRAVIDGRTYGMCKLIVNRRTSQVLGAHVVGEQALEIVHMIAAGMAAQTTVDHLAALEIAYPTFTAVLGLAARRAVREIHGTDLSVEWRTIESPFPAEWERRD